MVFLTAVSGSQAIAAKPDKPNKEADLRAAMDKLWEDHVTWTRVFIISAVAGSPDKDAATKRLLQNQDDIGNAIKPFYGDAAGAKLTALLREHILIAADVVTAAKAGDKAKLDAANTRWHANADEIAAFLAKANPAWHLDDMKAMMKDHLDLTTAEAVARIHEDWNADVAAYDKVHDQILKMSKMLSDGIVQQFPRKFVPRC
ncbi:MAG TPA: hypothetical protein VL172_21310 [Kofleriaceae bacterium]|nr:hypothetical protein [Kofleriaceae bacterium]